MHDGMGNLEYLSWRAITVYRNAQHALAMQEIKAEKRGR